MEYQKTPLRQIARMRRRTRGISESATEADSSDEETNTWNGINPTEQSGDASNAMANMMAEFLKMQREQKKEMKRMKKELDRARRGDEWSEREKVPKYTKMSEGEDVVAFLEEFESHTESYKVPVDDWTRQLKPLLTETARKVYTRLTAEEKKDYAGVSKATLQYYHVTRDTYRRKLDEAVRETKEGWLLFGKRLKYLAEQWFNECNSTDEVIDVFITELELKPQKVEQYL